MICNIICFTDKGEELANRIVNSFSLDGNNKDKYIVNISRYTDVTRILQRKINSIIPENKRITVEKVTWDYAGKLADYLK